ncbi:hypothetical protein P3S68_017124 [Capsicum galapagoense]
MTKSVAVNIKGANVAKKVPAEKKPAQKKATIKPRPEEIIVIIPNTREKLMEEKMQRKKQAAEDISKKKSTLTSTLTARSKNVNNELAVLEYVEEIYSFYKLAESETRVHDYIDSQPAINEKMRAIIIDWLIEVHHKFELNPETFYLTINIVDRYLGVETASRREL